MPTKIQGKKIPIDGDHKCARSDAQATIQKKSRERRFAWAAWHGTFLRHNVDLNGAIDSSIAAQSASDQ
jgi:hypothetical protein